MIFNIDNRVIRIFISSTFKDMEAEREYLRAKVFPLLQAEATKRNVSLIPLDLRWGITDEESKSGKVLEVCLREIENSHPFFIGMVGSRYGWCPTNDELKKNEYLSDRYDWIGKDIDNGLSVTEMEMQYGVLRNPKNMNAYFFIKDDSFSEDNEPEDSGVFSKLRNSIFGKKDSPLKKLENLKAQLRSNSRYPVYAYSSVEEIGKQVEKDFKELLDKLYPLGEQSLLVQERLSQVSFMRSRCEVYTPNTENYQKLDSWFAGNEPALVVSGQRGIGKSALIANWLQSRGDKLGKTIFHFIGNGGKEGSYNAITQRICREIQDLYKLDTIIPENKKPEDILDELVSQIAGKEPLLIVLDGVNQLADCDNAKLMNWLPKPTANVRYLFTTLADDTTMETFKNRYYPVFNISPLNRDERKRLTVDYLSYLSKHLPERLIDRIIDDKKCENTLVLRTLLDELANYGNHERLSERIDYYLSADSLEDFFQRVLTRYEEDYGKENIGKIMSLIAYSCNGISEQELLDIVNLKPLEWSQIYCALLSQINLQNGLITFSNRYLHNAATEYYASLERAARCAILNHFGSRIDSRAADELLYQYYSLGEHKLLYRYLLNFKVFSHLQNKDSIELAKYWKYLQNIDSNMYKLSDYMELPQVGDAETGFYYNNISYFITNFFANLPLALEYQQKALTLQKKSLGEKHINVANSYNNLGHIYDRLNEDDEAIDSFTKSLDICLSLYGENHIGVATAYNNIACLLLKIGDFKKALDYSMKSLAIIKRLYGESHSLTATLYGNISAIYGKLGDAEKAIEYSTRALDIKKEVYGNHNPELSFIYRDLGDACKNSGDYYAAKEHYEQALEIDKSAYGENHPLVAIDYNNLGAIYNYLNNSYEALDYYQKSVEISKKLYGEKHDDVATAYSNISALYLKINEPEKALEYEVDALNIFIANGGAQCLKVANLYTLIGETYKLLDDSTTRLSYLLNAFNIYDSFPNYIHQDFADLCNHIGVIYYGNNDFDNARKYFLKNLEISLKLINSNEAYIANSYNSIGTTYARQGNYSKALEYYLKSLALRESIYSEPNDDIAETVENIAVSYNEIHDYKNALAYYLKYVDIKRTMGSRDDMFDMLNAYDSIGEIYCTQKEYSKALEYFMNVNKLCMTLLGDNNANTLESFNSILKVYSLQEDYPKVLDTNLKMLKMAIALYGEDTPTVRVIYRNLSQCYEKLGDTANAAKYKGLADGWL